MNTTAQALVFAVVSVAAAASIGMGLADHMAQPAGKTVTLERVVVIGQRAELPVIAQLPRVVIVGRSNLARADLPELKLAATKQAAKTI